MRAVCCAGLIYGITFCSGGSLTAGAEVVPPSSRFLSHPPMRPLPVTTSREMTTGNGHFVDPNHGNDAHPGTLEAPWRSLKYAVRQLQPGDTLYLREGVHYERVVLSRSGTPESPITIRSYPGETVTIDGSLPEFHTNPAEAWEPNPSGVPGEFVSTRSYLEFDTRIVPKQFLPACWEPMLGIEDERPLALGHFADSMVPLHGYRTLADLRATNELWLGNKVEMRDVGIYAGPGLWFNRETGRIHIRLAHHTLPGLGDRAYRGVTDPRKVPLIVAVGFGDDVLRINGIQHVVIQDLIFRGGTGSPLLHVYGSQGIKFDHCTVFGGFPGLLVNATQDLKVLHCAFRGLAAPWNSRAHMKYRGTASYQIILQDQQPLNERLEFAYCEFTDDHDFAFLRFAKDLQFHHNFVDNFNDDGIECGPKLRDHTIAVHHNRIGRCLIPLAQHEITKDESPLEHDPDSGISIYRNVFDMRGGVYGSPPQEIDATGDYLRREGHLASDHGSPIWPVMRVYHNTLLRDGPVFRDYFLFGLGAAGLRDTERDVFNNLFIQAQGVPGVNLGGMKVPARLREGGNLLWGYQPGSPANSDPWGKFRASPLFEASRQQYPPGWTTEDFIADPGFIRYAGDAAHPPDLSLQPGSRAVDAGVVCPEHWPDPERPFDAGRPDIGALPLGQKPWSVGVDGRVPLFGS